MTDIKHITNNQILPEINNDKLVEDDIQKYYDQINNFCNQYELNEIIVKIFKSLNENRTIVINQIFTLASNNYKFITMKFDEKLLISMHVEKICYNHCIKIATDKGIDRSWNNEFLTNIYDTITSRILEYIDYNKEICFDMSFDYEFVINESYEVIYPEYFRAELDYINGRRNAKFDKKYSKLQCPKCQQYKIIFEQKQLRSPDEPPQYKCTCDNCGFRFKKNNI